MSAPKRPGVCAPLGLLIPLQARRKVMAQFDKWIDGISANDSVCESAQHSLSARLAAVEHYLPLAADCADDDIECVHQLRVYTRRSMAVLKLYADLLPKKEARWFGKTLRRIRRAAGNARDLDVLAESIEDDTDKEARKFLADIRQRRKAAQRPIVAIHRKLKRHGRLRHRIEDLLQKTAPQATDGPFGSWATVRLRKTLQRFFRASPSDRRDLGSLHRFRIRGKELRYTLELLAPAFSNELRDELYPVVEQLQERLGEIHDHVVAIARFRRLVAKAKSKKKAFHVRKLLERDVVALDKRLREFSSWWTPEFETQFRDSFERLIAQSATDAPEVPEAGR